jgi:hypothetical protein
MATRKPAGTAVAKAKSTAVTSWQDKLAQYATDASAQEAAVAGGQFFGLKSGVLTFNGNPMPNNEMAVIVIDSVLENVYYEGRYDPDTPQAPICFAFGRDDKTMEPHKLVVEAGTNQCEQCHGCPMNEFGSADTGKGKACRNTRRVAMISAGSFNKQGEFIQADGVEHFAEAELAYMKLPVTSVKGYAAYVKQVEATMKRPPFAVFTRVSVVPDAKSQFKVVFEALEEVPDELIETLIARHEETKQLIDFPYQPAEEQEQKPARGKVAGKAPSKARARKY